MLKYLLALVALAPISALAQDSDTQDLPRWYQIELLIFQQNDVDTEELLREQPFEHDHNSILSDAARLNPLLNKLANGKAQPAAPIPEMATETEITPDGFEQAYTTADDTALELASEAGSAPATSPETPEFIAASAEELILAEHEEKLRRRRAYRVLWHGAWQQALEEGSSNDYLISAGRLVLQPASEAIAPAHETPESSTDENPLDRLIDSLSTDEEGSPSATPLADTGNELMTDAQRLAEAQAIVASAPATFRELQGTIKLFKTLFAHLDIDLWFTQIDPQAPSLNVPQLHIHEPEPDQVVTAAQTETAEIPAVTAQDFLEESGLAFNQNEEAPATPSYTMSYEAAYEPELYGHIREDRRLRPEELYYVDHPLFGMVVKMIEVPHPSLRVEPETMSDETDPLAF